MSEALEGTTCRTLIRWAALIAVAASLSVTRAESPTSVALGEESPTGGGTVIEPKAGVPAWVLAASASPNAVVVSNEVKYNYNLTNQWGVRLTNVLVTSTLPTSAKILSTSASAGTTSTNTNGVTFHIDAMANGANALLTLTARPTAVGTLTNLVAVSATNTTTTAASVVIRVFAAQADLGVTLTGLPTSVLVDDWLSQALTVTNRGPDAASNVVLNSSLPAQATLISVMPTNQAYSVTNGSLLFNLGTVAPGASANVQITLQPTNTGVLTLSNRVSATSALDTNAANNSASSTLDVGSFLAGQLVASVISPQQYNPQTGLMEQTVRLSNVGTQQVASARVVVSGLNGQLLNAVGTNNGNPFVVFGSTLDAGQSVDLVLEYFVPTRHAVPDPAFTALEVPPPSLTAPASPPPNITQVVLVAPGTVLLEFQSVPGRSYTVLYCADAGFTNALTAQPAIVAPADRVQWIDAGPPKTASRLTNGMTRFYRVLQDP